MEKDRCEKGGPCRLRTRSIPSHNTASAQNAIVAVTAAASRGFVLMRIVFVT
jgi:hypothetical protein